MLSSVSPKSAVVQWSVQGSFGNANAAYSCCSWGEATQLYILVSSNWIIKPVCFRWWMFVFIVSTCMQIVVVWSLLHIPGDYQIGHISRASTAERGKKHFFKLVHTFSIKQFIQQPLLQTCYCGSYLVLTARLRCTIHLFSLQLTRWIIPRSDKGFLF